MGIFDGILLVSDMDATLLKDDHSVSENNKQAINFFISNGGMFTAASGRMRDAVKSYMNSFTINAPAILHNGAKIYDFKNDEILFQKFIEPKRKNAIKRVYKDNLPLGIEIYSNELTYIYKACAETERFKTRNYPISYDTDKIWNDDWIKVLLIADKDVLDYYEKLYRKHYDSGYSVRSGSKFLDIVANGVSKGKALSKLRKITNAKTVIAVGDNMNDISMLEEADISFAVKNAADETKKAALYQAPDNNNDAISYIVDFLHSGKHNNCRRY